VTEDRDRGRRLLAFAALWLLIAGLLSALSFFVVAIVLTMILIVAVGAGLALWTLRNYGANGVAWVGPRTRDAAAWLGGRSRGAARSAGAGSQRAAAWFGPRSRSAGRSARQLASSAPSRSRSLADRLGQGYAAAVYRTSAVTARTLEGVGRRRALRLNERGTELRRGGHPEEAVEQHRVALDIVRDLGDPQAEAATLNNLGLAYAQGGAPDAAVKYLEQALTVLQQVGDEEHEGQVIANLGLIHRQTGHSRQAELLLQEALAKLPPESSTYRQIEAELRHAS
jgi:tetratricopeptide (TPR) repeat protein